MRDMPNASFRRPAFRAVPPRAGTHPEQEEVTSLLDLVCFNACHNPTRQFCIQSHANRKQTDQSGPDDSGYDGVSITFGQLESAIYNCAESLRKRFSTSYEANSPESRRPIAIYLESDVGLFIHVLALQSLQIPVRFTTAH